MCNTHSKSQRGGFFAESFCVNRGKKPDTMALREGEEEIIEKLRAVKDCSPDMCKGTLAGLNVFYKEVIKK